MNKPSQTVLCAAVAALLCAGAAAVADDEQLVHCEDQARIILERLEAEVVGDMSASQRGSARQIVLDVCLDREAQVDMEVREAVQQAREEEQENAASWWENSPDSAGNTRLKRKQH